MNEMDRMRESHTELREALIEVKEWIDNWNPNFIYDDEWDDTEIKISVAIDIAKTFDA